MHKSVFTFGLLMSSLVMLSAMPILNQQQNNFLITAMAQRYNDDFYGDTSSYSKYPTDDKKYECRTGPFEGFFVSSVEFCKFNKFDIEKILVEIIKQEHQAHLVHQEHQEQQEQLVLLV
jgi:hypothetical protein